MSALASPSAGVEGVHEGTNDVGQGPSHPFGLDSGVVPCVALHLSDRSDDLSNDTDNVGLRSKRGNHIRG